LFTRTGALGTNLERNATCASAISTEGRSVRAFSCSADAQPVTIAEIRTMQSRFLSVAIMLVVLGVVPLSARSQSTSSATTYTIGANAGVVMPVSDLGDLTSSGYTIGATLGMHQPLSPLNFRVEGSFTELPFKDEIAQGAKHRIYGFALDGQYNLGTPSANGGLYVTGGVGYFGTKDTNIPSFVFGPTESATTWNFGINAGLGYYLPLSGFTMYFEGRYRNIFSDTHQVMFPITVGIAF
jgi:hypothetical protein